MLELSPISCSVLKHVLSRVLNMMNIMKAAVMSLQYSQGCFRLECMLE